MRRREPKMSEVKRTYESPALVEYGSITKLTHSGSGVVPDSMAPANYTFDMGMAISDTSFD